MIVTKLNPLTTEFAYKADEPIELLLASDVHFDNPKCRRDIFFRHLNEAKKRGAKVAIFGDLFCLMQGKYDPRRSKKDIIKSGFLLYTPAYKYAGDMLYFKLAL